MVPERIPNGMICDNVGPPIRQGVHLIRHALLRTRDAGGQAVLLGSGHADGDFRALADGEFRRAPTQGLRRL